MNRKIYLTLIWIVTGVCIIVGLLIHLGYWGASWKSEGEEGSVSLEGSAELEAFDSLEIDAGVMTLNIKVGDTYGFGYECANSKLVPKWSIKDGKLVIKQQESQMILGNSSCLVTITIPNGSSLEKAEIDIGVGDIYISGCEIEKLEMDSGTGNIDVNGVFYTVEADSGIGNINIEASAFDKIDADSGTGDISIKCEGDLSEYTLDLDAGVGSITLDGSKVGQQVTTSEYKSQGSGGGKISADTGVGDIEIYGQ